MVGATYDSTTMKKEFTNIGLTQTTQHLGKTEELCGYGRCDVSRTEGCEGRKQCRDDLKMVALGPQSSFTRPLVLKDAEDDDCCSGKRLSKSRFDSVSAEPHGTKDCTFSMPL